MKRTLLITLALWFTTLAVGVAAFLLANFGASKWIFVVMFAWMATLGLPTLVAVLMLASLWHNLPFAAFLVCAATLAFLFQLAAVWLVQRLLRNRRKRVAA